MKRAMVCLLGLWSSLMAAPVQLHAGSDIDTLEKVRRTGELVIGYYEGEQGCCFTIKLPLRQSAMPVLGVA